MNVTDNQQERLVDLAWIAGLWEADGCFSIFKGSKSRLYAASSFVNSDKKLIEAVHSSLKRLGVGHYISTRKLSEKNSNHKDQQIIYVAGFKRAEKFIDLILPFLRGRKSEVAEVVKAFIVHRLSNYKGHYTKEDFEFIEKVRKLNKKGPPKSSEAIR